MGLVVSSKTIGEVTEIECNGILEVMLAISAAPDIINNPADIVLVLDHSRSMAGQPLVDLKAAANVFIDIISDATGGAPDEILGGTNIGVVGFAGTASVASPLTSSVPELKTAINGLVTESRTNHGDAFQTAADLLSASTKHKVMLMFTDGNTTAGPDPSPIAAAARADGIEIYCIGLIGTDGIDPANLYDWASLPTATHVVITPNSSELEQIFEDLAINIAKSGATNISITELLNPDFKIVGAVSADKGTITPISDQSFLWEIDSLGETNTESAIATFQIQHIGVTGGIKAINDSIIYNDDQDNIADFDDPTVMVVCSNDVIADGCPQPIEIDILSCEDSIEFHAGDLLLDGTGRILQLDVNLLSICPGKRVALAVILTELDEEGQPQPLGMKTYTIPAQAGDACVDVLVKCINFVLPEDGTLCQERVVRAQLIAHYIDFGFNCCENFG